MADKEAGQQEKYKVDVNVLFADYVRDARIESGSSSQGISRRLFMEAAALASNDAGLRLAFIECRPRDHLVASIEGEAAAAAWPGLEQVAVKYATTPDMFRALMAAWHCGTAQTATTAAYTESEFLIWRPETDGEAGQGATGGFGEPDYMFIDGLDAIADENSMWRLWAITNSALDHINRAREARGDSNKCALVVGIAG
ncbi:hypothetical protein GGF39_002578 [Coemansia sp. RSA 1721]|nr:hypothetical protein GGF39_002578 [Coemansia sp. RSA 1721]